MRDAKTLFLALLLVAAACSTAPTGSEIDVALSRGHELACRFAAQEGFTLRVETSPAVAIVSTSELYRQYADAKMIPVSAVPKGLRGFCDYVNRRVVLLHWEMDTFHHELGHWYFGLSEDVADAFMRFERTA
ncbi:MAG: hypothetical protein GY851_03370 [bacterium]|nr:hypothetical protein [bacterium]